MFEDYLFFYSIVGDVMLKMMILSLNMLFFCGKLEKDVYKNDYYFFQYDVFKVYKKVI